MAVRSTMSDDDGSTSNDSQSHKKRRLDDRSMGPAAGAELAAEKQLVLKLLEPFSREQLLEILTSAATQHEDVLNEIKAVASADVAHRKVFVRGLAWETTTERLKTAFAVFGTVEEAAVIFDKSSGKSRGYGFVTFVEMDGAQRAVDKQNIEIDGRTTTCNLAAVRANADDHQAHMHPTHAAHYHHHQGQNRAAPVPPTATAPYTVYTTPYVAPGAPPMAMAPPPAAVANGTNGVANDEDSRKLFVRGLSWDTTDETLRTEFQQFGELVEATVVRERKTGKSKGFGFVTYRYRAGADTALQEPHKVIDGRNVTCNLASLGRNQAVNTQPGMHMPVDPAAYGAYPPAGYPPAPQPPMVHDGMAMYGGVYPGAAPGPVQDPHRHPYPYGGAPYYPPQSGPPPPAAPQRK